MGWDILPLLKDLNLIAELVMQAHTNEHEVNNNKSIKEINHPHTTFDKGLEKKKVTKTNLRYQRDKDREPVKGIFRFYEVPGGRLEFVFKAYKEDPVEKFDLFDGHVYTLPLGVAKHLNKNGSYPIHSYMMDENGKHAMKIAQRVRRFGFQSLEFVDIDDLGEVGSPIITVESTGIL
jgi:hypothetical protein